MFQHRPPPPFLPGPGFELAAPHSDPGRGHAVGAMRRAGAAGLAAEAAVRAMLAAVCG